MCSWSLKLDGPKSRSKIRDILWSSRVGLGIRLAISFQKVKNPNIGCQMDNLGKQERKCYKDNELYV
jgi:hypothetical protein